MTQSISFPKFEKLLIFLLSSIELTNCSSQLKDLNLCSFFGFPNYCYCHFFCQVKGFPAKLNTKNEVIDMVAKLIWLMSVKHSAVNFPITDYGAFTPLTPTMVYNDTRVPPGEFAVYNLPNGNISSVSVSTPSLLLECFEKCGKKKDCHLQNLAPQLNALRELSKERINATKSDVSRSSS